MSPLAGIAISLTRSLGFRTSAGRKPQRNRRGVEDVHRRLGIGFTRTPIGRRTSIWLVPVCVLGCVVAALVIAHVRVELISQGYQRANNVKRHQQLEEEQRNLAARVRELRNPARLAALAEEMGLSRPKHVISLAPTGYGSRP